jgi:mxaJ protein
MSFRFELVLSLLITAAVYTASRRAAADPPHLLRVCADPNDLPFSNQRGEGFENRIASVIGRDLDLSVRYTWWPQGRGVVRNALNAGRCDVIMGIPAGFEGVVRTSPYYRSTYVFVTRDTQLRDRIQAALDRHRDEIRDILQSYGVPLLTPPAARP